MKTSLQFALISLLLFAPVTALSLEQRLVIPLENSPSLGPDNAPVTIVEFIDFQ